MKITLSGDKELEAVLTKMADINWDPIWSKQGEEMKRKSDAVTPYRTGALRRSATYQQGEFGYTVDYADDVNYGHRTRGGGFVSGQHFLEEVVNGQDQQYKDEVLKYLKETVK